MVKLVPADGLPSELDLDDEAAWQVLVTGQLDRVRKSAENWRNGLAAVASLITASWVIKGPSDIQGLDRPFAYAAGALFLAGLALACYGMWMCIVAANGTLSVITREQVHRLGGVTGFNLHLAGNSVSKLRIAQLASIAALLAIAASVVVTWYGPRNTSVMLEAKRKSQPTVCGTFVESAAGYIDLRPATSPAVRIRLDDLSTVRAVTSCP